MERLDEETDVISDRHPHELRDDRFQQTTQTDSDPDDNEDVSEPTPERSGRTSPASTSYGYMTTRSGRISKPPNRMDL